MESKFLGIILDIASHLKVPTVVIGGLALPAYNVARTTLDIDICIYIKSQDELNQFIKILKENNILTAQNPKVDQDLFTVFGKNNEAEIWLRPCDYFEWDDQMIKKISPFFENVSVLSIEDFILTKLARADRSSIDIDDIMQIFIANQKKIDWDYLNFRLKKYKLKDDFIEVLSASDLEINADLQELITKIVSTLKELD